MYTRQHTRPTVISTLLLCSALAFVLLLGPGCRPASEPVVVPSETTSSSEPSSPPASQTDLAAIELALSPVADGFEQPLFVTGAGDGSNRLFVCEKTGRIQLVEGGKIATAVFLDLSRVVSTESEQGLLGLAFSPEFKTTRRFYVNYTDSSGATVVSRFTAVADGSKADPASEEVLLRIEQPYANHNGGCVQFGPDKMLWIGMGDGGSGGDPQGNGQNPDALLGKMLRIDVGESGVPANGEPYGIPSDNPYANPTDETAGQPEIWAMGLRNPWRFSFDPKTGDLWIGDVGQSAWEEIDYVAAGSAGVPVGGLNFGWNVLEARHPYPEGGAAPKDASRYTPPVIEYDRTAGRSVTGGVVVRDPATPQLDGVYLYGDFETGRVWGVRREGKTTGAGTTSGLRNVELLATKHQVVSFGVGDKGEVYLVDFAGALYRVGVK